MNYFYSISLNFFFIRCVWLWDDTRYFKESKSRWNCWDTSLWLRQCYKVSVKKVSVLLSENFLGLFGTGKLLNSFPKNCTLLTARRKLIALPKNRTQQSWQILGLNIMSFSPMYLTYFALLLKQAHRLMILVWFDQPSDHTIY